MIFTNKQNTNKQNLNNLNLKILKKVNYKNNESEI